MRSLEELMAQPASPVKKSLRSSWRTSSSDDQTAETSFSSSESKEKPKVPFFSRIRRRNVPKQRGSSASKKECVPEKEPLPETIEVESVTSEELYSDPPVPVPPESPPVPESPESSISCSSVKSQDYCSAEKEVAVASNLTNTKSISCSSVKLQDYCSAEKEVDVASNLTTTKIWTQQRDYWKNIVLKRSVQLGPTHIRTAEALMDLGHAYLLCEESLEAGKAYLSALKIYQAIHGDYHLSVARALDKLGLAACKTHANLDLALVALTDALKIRCELLGPDHVDSVDTLNNIAGVRLNMKEFEVAARNYHAVFRYRENLFGRNHASVAVTAYTLACILDDILMRPKEARAFFLISLSVYEALGLDNSPYAVEARRRVPTGDDDGKTFKVDALRVEKIPLTVRFQFDQ